MSRAPLAVCKNLLSDSPSNQQSSLLNFWSRCSPKLLMLEPSGILIRQQLVAVSPIAQGRIPAVPGSTELSLCISSQQVSQMHAKLNNDYNNILRDCFNEVISKIKHSYESIILGSELNIKSCPILSQLALPSLR